MSAATSLLSTVELSPGVKMLPQRAPVDLILEDLIALLERRDADGALRYARTAAAELDHRRRPVSDRSAPGPRRPRLTSREIETLRLLADGAMSQKDLARTLGVSRDTVKSHIKSIYMKFGIHSRYEAIQTGRELGLIPRHEAPATPDLQPVQRLMLVNGSSRRE